MERKGFVFYTNWKKSLEGMPDDIRLEVYESVIDYALTENVPKLTPMAQVAFNFMKPGLDLDIEKYKATVERNRANASSKGIKIATGNRENKDIAAATQTNPVALNKDKNKDKDKNKNKKESTNVDKKETSVSSFSHDYEKFLQWLYTNAPYCADAKNFPQQITETEFSKLKEKYTGKQIADVIEQIENRKDLRKRYTNLYRTVLNWAKRAYGN